MTKVSMIEELRSRREAKLIPEELSRIASPRSLTGAPVLHEVLNLACPCYNNREPLSLL